MPTSFRVEGQNSTALFTLKIHRGDGMCLVTMNWKNGTPPSNFVGFSIEYQQPADPKFYPLKNRLCFPNANSNDPNRFSTLQSPIQKFRWVHFPRNAARGRLHVPRPASFHEPAGPTQLWRCTRSQNSTQPPDLSEPIKRGIHAWFCLIPGFRGSLSIRQRYSSRKS